MEYRARSPRIRRSSRDLPDSRDAGMLSLMFFRYIRIAACFVAVTGVSQMTAQAPSPTPVPAGFVLQNLDAVAPIAECSTLESAALSLIVGATVKIESAEAYRMAGPHHIAA
jgi:hypothetical protein